MRRLNLIIITAFVIVLSLWAQPRDSYSREDESLMQLPDSLTKSTSGIARYIKLHFSTQTDQSRAIFIWIARNIRYDIQMVTSPKIYHQRSEVVDEVLKSRKGICMHYAELYADIANKLSIKTYVVAGYTKQYGAVDKISHAWCVSRIDSSWTLIDPTWGTGYMQNGKFVRKINNEYFKAEPLLFLHSHMPFDPLWQLMKRPISNQEFYEGKIVADPHKALFSYNDSIVSYENQDEESRLEASSRRIEMCGVKNALIAQALEQNKLQLKAIQSQKCSELFNAATKRYNNGIFLLNQFISYRNKQFVPSKSDGEIKQMVDTVANALAMSKMEVNKIKSADSKMLSLISKLKLSITEAESVLEDQKVFVNKYLSTNKMLRKSLFIKYSIGGIPLN